MVKLSTETLHKMLRSPFAETVALLMNGNETSLLNTAAYNLQMASGSPGQDAFVKEMLLPHLENQIVMDLPVYSSGGRAQTAQVLNDLLGLFEEDLGITFNSDEKSSAMKYAILFVCAVCHIRNTSLAEALGIRKTGFFRPRWQCTT